MLQMEARMKASNRLLMVCSFLLLSVAPAFAGPGDGIFVRTNELQCPRPSQNTRCGCDSIPHKTANRTICLDASESVLKLYNGSGWTEISINRDRDPHRQPGEPVETMF